MKVAISTDQGYVSAHFGRCSTYTVIEIKEGQMLSREEIANPGHQPGFLPQYLSDKGVNCIIAGGMGPRAQALFAQGLSHVGNGPRRQRKRPGIRNRSKVREGQLFSAPRP